MKLRTVYATVVKRLFWKPSRIAGRARHSLSLRAHCLAILVHQRKDPTLPYQALVSRESARLFLRVFPLGRLGVLATRDRAS